MYILTFYMYSILETIIALLLSKFTNAEIYNTENIWKFEKKV